MAEAENKNHFVLVHGAIVVGHDLGGLNLALAMDLFPHKISVGVFLSAFMPDTIHQPLYLVDKPRRDFHDYNNGSKFLEIQALSEPRTGENIGEARIIVSSRSAKGKEVVG
ncbi:hypothetical protein GOBAR_DD02432 [Gossypium barbadense]|nr:hypothetical protein GOBAR_DD02432 [Gossypium barbadense]